LGQARDKVRQYLKEHPKLVQELTGKILAAGGHAALAIDADQSSASAEEDGAVVAEE
jgi:hypothetical protein